MFVQTAAILLGGWMATAESAIPDDTGFPGEVFWGKYGPTFKARGGFKVLINWSGPEHGLQQAFTEGHGSRRSDFEALVRQAVEQWQATGIPLELHGIEYTPAGTDPGWHTSSSGWKDQVDPGTVLLFAARMEDSPWGWANYAPDRAGIRLNLENEDGVTKIWDMVPSEDLDASFCEHNCKRDCASEFPNDPSAEQACRDACPERCDNRHWAYPTMFHELGHALGLRDVHSCEGRLEECKPDCRRACQPDCELEQNPLACIDTCAAPCEANCDTELLLCQQFAELPEGTHVMISGASASFTGTYARLRGPTPWEVSELREKYGTRDLRTTLLRKDADAPWSRTLERLPPNIESLFGVDITRSPHEDEYTITWVDDRGLVHIAYLDEHGRTRKERELDEVQGSSLTAASIAHDGHDTAIVAYTEPGDQLIPLVAVIEQDLGLVQYVRVDEHEAVIGAPDIAYIESEGIWVYAAVIQGPHWYRASEVSVWTSRDDGRTWSSPRSVSGNHAAYGGVALACDSIGNCRVSFETAGYEDYTTGLTGLNHVELQVSPVGSVSRRDHTGTLIESRIKPSMASRDDSPGYLLTHGRAERSEPYFAAGDSPGSSFMSSEPMLDGLEVASSLNVCAPDPAEASWAAVATFEAARSCELDCRDRCRLELNACAVDEDDPSSEARCLDARTVCFESYCPTLCTRACPDQNPGCDALWAAGHSYSVGNIVDHQGEAYECLQAHQAQVDWPPHLTPALWRPIDLRQENDAWAVGVGYAVGDRVNWQDDPYTCIIAHTGTLGWEPHLTPALWQRE